MALDCIQYPIYIVKRYFLDCVRGIYLTLQYLAFGQDQLAAFLKTTCEESPCNCAN